MVDVAQGMAAGTEITVAQPAVMCQYALETHQVPHRLAAPMGTQVKLYSPVRAMHVTPVALARHPQTRFVGMAYSNGFELGFAFGLLRNHSRTDFGRDIDQGSSADPAAKDGSQQFVPPLVRHVVLVVHTGHQDVDAATALCGVDHTGGESSSFFADTGGRQGECLVPRLRAGAGREASLKSSWPVRVAW